jgi:hypothetical protein
MKHLFFSPFFCFLKTCSKIAALFRQSQRFFGSWPISGFKSFFSDKSVRPSPPRKTRYKITYPLPNISAHAYYCSCVEHGINAALAVISHHQIQNWSPVLQNLRFRNSTILPLRNYFQILVVTIGSYYTIRPEQIS